MTRIDSLAPRLLLAGAVAFQALFLRFELLLPFVPTGDDLLHLVLVRRTLQAFAAGFDPTDHWVPEWVFGYPMFHHYPHLPHVVTAAVAAPFGEDSALSVYFAVK